MCVKLYSFNIFYTIFKRNSISPGFSNPNFEGCQKNRPESRGSDQFAKKKTWQAYYVSNISFRTVMPHSNEMDLLDRKSNKMLQNANKNPKVTVTK